MGRARRAWEQRPAAGLGAHGPCSMPSLPSCPLCPQTACASCGPRRLVLRCAAPVPATRTSSRAGPVRNLFCKTQSSVRIWGELGLRMCGEGLHLPEEPRARREVAMRRSGPSQACCAGGEPLPPSAGHRRPRGAAFSPQTLFGGSCPALCPPVYDQSAGRNLPGSASPVAGVPRLGSLHLPAHCRDLCCLPPCPGPLAGRLLPGWLGKRGLLAALPAAFPRGVRPDPALSAHGKMSLEKKPSRQRLRPQRKEPRAPALRFLLDTALQQEGLPAGAPGRAPSAAWAWVSARADAVQLLQEK